MRERQRQREVNGNIDKQIERERDRRKEKGQSEKTRKTKKHKRRRKSAKIISETAAEGEPVAANAMRDRQMHRLTYPAAGEERKRKRKEETVGDLMRFRQPEGDQATELCHAPVKDPATLACEGSCLSFPFCKRLRPILLLGISFFPRGSCKGIKL